MGDTAIVRANFTGMIYPEGEVLPPGLPSSPAAIEPVAPGLPAAGIPLDEFRPGDPLFGTAQEALQYKEAARSPATKRAYEADFRLFEEWCGQAGLASLPATISTIGLYMTDLATGGAKVRPSAASWRQSPFGTRKIIKHRSSDVVEANPLIASVRFVAILERFRKGDLFASWNASPTLGLIIPSRILLNRPSTLAKMITSRSLSA